MTICIHITYINTCYAYIVTQCHTHTHMYTHTHMVANTCRFRRSTIVMHPGCVQIVCMNVHIVTVVYACIHVPVRCVYIIHYIYFANTLLV